MEPFTLQTIGTREESRWVAKLQRDENGRTRKVNNLVTEKLRQAIMNDEEAAWLLQNHPDLEWKKHSEGGLAVIIDGYRYRITHAQLAASKPDAPDALSRAEIVAKAKSLDIKTNQKSKVLLELIAEAEKDHDDE